jgi:two-component system NtrC family response regulator
MSEDNCIRPKDLPSNIRMSVDPDQNENFNNLLSLKEMEREHIVQALEKMKGHRGKAAKALNISERTLYRKLKEYRLFEDPPRYNPS